MKHSTEIHYIRTYSIAQWIRNTIIENDPKEYLLDFFEIDDYFIEKALKPSKKSILHKFINEKLELELDTEYPGQRWPNYKEWNKLTEKHLSLTINEKKFYKFENGYKDQIYYQLIEKVLPIVTDEVFFLLFNDREFLFHFNIIISTKIKSLLKTECPRLLKSDGVIKRVTFILWGLSKKFI